ncbi:response regulator [Afifella pfennigii]|uniref:response regulator n=1 Tax=Afifella pfennigii TaxID=209897 RepID=UPI00047B2829|nr:response regulator [Afifella pfennigii]
MEANRPRLRILVLDDEAMIAGEIKLLLEDAGHEVVGPVGSLEAAMQLADSAAIDLAILDANIRQHSSGPVARRLVERAIPFCVCTGDESEELREDFGEVELLPKPFGENDLLSMVASLTGTRSGALVSS